MQMYLNAPVQLLSVVNTYSYVATFKYFMENAYGKAFQTGKSLIGGGSLGAKNLNSHEWEGRTLLNWESSTS